MSEHINVVFIVLLSIPMPTAAHFIYLAYTVSNIVISHITEMGISIASELAANEINVCFPYGLVYTLA